MCTNFNIQFKISINIKNIKYIESYLEEITEILENSTRLVII